MIKEELLLYLITDSGELKGRSLYDAVTDAIKGGITILQYREKHLPYENRKQEAVELLNLCHKNNIKLIINDDVLLAKEIDADGVHVGQSDMGVFEARKILGKNKIIGATAKTVEQAKKAEKFGADYLGSGAVFGSITKKDALPMSVENLEEICQSVNIPVVAIGGINIGNVQKLKNTGIAGVAVISGILGFDDIKEITEKFVKILK